MQYYQLQIQTKDIEEDDLMTDIEAQVSRKSQFEKWLQNEKQFTLNNTNKVVIRLQTLSDDIQNPFSFQMTTDVDIKQFLKNSFKSKKFKRLANTDRISILNALRLYSDFLSKKPEVVGIIQADEPVQKEGTLIGDVLGESKYQDVVAETHIVDFSRKINYSHTKPYKFELHGKMRETRNWADLLVQLCKILLNIAPDELQILGMQPVTKYSGTLYFSYNKTMLRIPKEFSDGLWVETDLSATEIVFVCKKLCKKCTISTNDLRIYYIDEDQNKEITKILVPNTKTESHSASDQHTNLSVKTPEAVENIPRVESNQEESTLISNVLTDSKYKLFVETLEKDNITTLEQLRNTNILKYLNVNDLFDWRDRIRIAESINLILESSMPSDQSIDIKLAGYKSVDNIHIVREDILVVDFSLQTDYSYTRPYKFELFGELYTTNNWAGLLVKFCKLVLQNNNEKMQTLINRPLSRDFNRSFLSTNQYYLRAPKKLHNGIWVETNYSATNIVEICRKLCDMFDISTYELKIYYVDNNPHKEFVRQTEHKTQPDAKLEQDNFSKDLGTSITNKISDVNAITSTQDRVSTSSYLSDNLHRADIHIKNSYTHKKPVKFILQGKEFEVNSWISVLIDACDELFEVYPEKMSALIDKPLGFECQKLFAQHSSCFKNAKKLRNGLFINSRLSAYGVLYNVRTACQKCGLPDDSFSVYVGPKKVLDVEPQLTFALTGSDKTSPAESNLSEEQKNYIEILSEHFQRGFKLNSVIDTKKLRMFYKEQFNAEIPYDDTTFNNILSQICIEYDAGRIMPPEIAIKQDVLSKILDYISNSFKTGKTVIYFERLYEQFQDELASTNVYNTKILKQVLNFYLGSKHCIRRSYLASSSYVEADPVIEIKELLISKAFPMSPDEIACDLPNMSCKKIKHTLLKTEFICVGKNLYTHIDCIDITSVDLQSIKDIILNRLDSDGYVLIKGLYSSVETENPGLLERYNIATPFCLKNILLYYFTTEFYFSGHVISQKGSFLSVSKIFEDFCSDKDSITMDELNNLANDLDVSLNGNYMDTIFENFIRLDSESFVRKGHLIFDSQPIDKAIEKFCLGDYIPIANIDRYAIFPSVGAAWTPFLLESYIRNYSHEFDIMSSSLSVSRCIGAIVKKTAGIANYDELLADAIVHGNISNISDAIAVADYLYAEGLIGNRRFKNVDDIITMAKRRSNLESDVKWHVLS